MPPSAAPPLSYFNLKDKIQSKITSSNKQIKEEESDEADEMEIFNENKNQTAKIANFYMVDESIIKNQFLTLANKYHQNNRKEHQEMEYRDDEIFKHSKIFGYAPDFKSKKYINMRIRKLT